MPSMYIPAVAGPGTFTLSATESDTFPENDVLQIAVPDSVFSRDDSTASGGLGFTGATGIFGNMFELTQPDVLTSVSYFLNSSTIGDSIRILLYGFGNDVPGQPDTLGGLLDSSAYFTISQLGWNTSTFPCQIPLDPGQYFIAVEQVNLNNLGFGYDLDNFQPGVTFFGDGIGPWTDYANLPASLQGHNLLRMNFGPTSGTSLTADATTVCPGDSVVLSASGSGTLTWAGTGINGATGSSVTVFPTADETYVVTLEDNNGCVSVDSIEISLSSNPEITLNGDTLVCAGSPANLVATGGTSFLWSNGDTTASITPAVTLPTTFVVTVANAFGCTTTDSLFVDTNETPSVSLDSTLAFFGVSNGTATATASGGTPPYTYLWDDPAAQDSATATGLAPGSYSVTVTDANGCSVTGTVNVTEATTAIEGQLEAGLIQVFPNPVQEYLILRGLEAFGPQVEVRATVLDLQGREVLRAVRHNEQELRLDLPATLPDGVYMIDLQSETLRAQTRVVRQR
ncbi:MAG: T9SS C-terminal target domain-containing protein [Bacteroidetes bacterium]|nr:MAG: T9SS C-terminal target domain-containing protein [Bacteroidota bacterium]